MLQKRVVGRNGFGSTGEVKKIDVLRIREWLDKECLVILSNLGCSSAGEVLNCKYANFSLLFFFPEELNFNLRSYFLQLYSIQ